MRQPNPLRLSADATQLPLQPTSQLTLTAEEKSED